VRCSLGTLFVVVTALSILLGVDRLLGCKFLGFAYFGGLLAMTSLPLVVAMLGRNSKDNRLIAEVVVIAGTLLVMHFAATAICLANLWQTMFGGSS